MYPTRISEPSRNGLSGSTSRDGRDGSAPKPDSTIKSSNFVSSDDVVYDACAGALFLSLRLSQKCRKVYAVEINPNVLGWALETIGFDMPTNLIAICGDALKMPLPPDVTKIILLHIHLEKPLPQSWRSKPIITSIGGRLRIWNPEKEEWLTLNRPSLLMR